MVAFPVVWFLVNMYFLPHPVRALWTWNHNVLCSLQLSIYNVKIIQLQSALGDEYNDFFQETSNLYHILEPIIVRLLRKELIPGRSLRSSFHWSIQVCKETLQHFARFWRLYLVRGLERGFPNMVLRKMNIYEHRTRVTRFNSLWVSDCT